MKSKQNIPFRRMKVGHAAGRAALLCVLLLCIGLIAAGMASAGETWLAKVATDRLNIRSEPSSKSRIVGSLERGATVSASDQAHGWVKISANGRAGWVAGQYLTKAKAAAPAVSTQSTQSAQTAQTAQSGKEAIVTADSLWLRNGPGTQWKATEALRKGAPLTVLKRQSGWAEVRTQNGASGWVSERYVDESSGLSVAKAAKRGGIQGKRIVIDPGHGGDDPGVIGHRYKTVEKTINLQTAQFVAEELRRAGAKVVMTRTKDDEKPELSQRAALSNRQGADAFISIHYNASPKKVSGTLTYYYSETRDRTLARSIEARLAKGTGLKSNGIAYGDYHVLRENKQPSVLLELGFLTDSGDEAVVRKEEYQRKAAQAIVSGIRDYFED